MLVVLACFWQMMAWLLAWVPSDPASEDAREFLEAQAELREAVERLQETLGVDLGWGIGRGQIVRPVGTGSRTTNVNPGAGRDNGGQPARLVGTGSRTMYVNTGAGRVNVRSAPRLAASVLMRVNHRASVEVLGEVQGDVFGDSTNWYRVSVEGEVGYVHGLLLSETKPVTRRSTSSSPDASVQNTPQQGTTSNSVTWHEGHPTSGTCKDNVFHQRIYRGCLEGISNDDMNALVRNMSCSSPSWQALGFECRGWYCVREGHAGTRCTP